MKLTSEIDARPPHVEDVLIVRHGYWVRLYFIALMGVVLIGALIWHSHQEPKPIMIKFGIYEFLIGLLLLFELIRLPKVFKKNAWVVAFSKSEIRINFRFFRRKEVNVTDLTVLKISHAEIGSLYKRRAKFQYPNGLKYPVTFLVITLKEDLSEPFKRCILVENAHVKPSTFYNKSQVMFLGTDPKELYIVWRHGEYALMPSIGSVLKKLQPTFEIRPPVYEVLKRIQDDPSIFIPPHEEVKAEVVIR